MTATHRTLQTYFISANGQCSEPVEQRIHVSRTCDNCTHFAPVSSQHWDTEAGGTCINLVHPAGTGQWCGEHQSREEFEAGTHMIDRPVLTLVKGGSPC